MPSESCPGESRLRKFLVGQMPPSDVEAIGIHVEACADCARLLEQWETQFDSVAEKLRGPDDETSLPIHQPGLGTTAPDSRTLENRIPDQSRSSEPPDELQYANSSAGSYPVTDRNTQTPRLDDLIASRYLLEHKLGEGGMGEVWAATQTTPVKRRVALKLIKKGMDSRSVLMRFEQERQALAVMDHPNIAKVLDGGLTPNRQPFFVMELVDGRPLTGFCDEHKLTPRERLELFLPICQAVQHAHQKGIVHRDLKPANILITTVDGKPVPKIIDFGVAKAIAGKLTEDTLSTQLGAVIGTLEYMAPEQAGFSTEDVDTRADIYSLGVILYELLTGLRPLDAKRLKHAALTEMIRVIREEEPSKPSTRLSTADSLPSLAALRQTDPRRLVASLRGELDWVVMKCLEKSRERRYETASGLARDIERYLADETVEARPPSTSYRLRKFLKRNRASVLAASLVLLTLIAGIVGTTYGLFREAAQREEAEQANTRSLEALAETRKAQAATAMALAQSEESRKQAEAVSDFLVDAFKKPNPLTYSAGKDVKLTEILDQAVAGLENQFNGSQAAKAALLDALGKSYFGLSLYPQAENALRKAWTIREPLLGSSNRQTLGTASELAICLWKLDRPDEALPLLKKTLEQQEAALGSDDLDTLDTHAELAAIMTVSGRAAEAIPLHIKILASRESKLGHDHLKTLTSRYYVALSHETLGRLPQAIELYESTLKLCETKLGVDHPHTVLVSANLGGAYGVAGQPAKAIPILERTLRQYETNLGRDHPNTLNIRSDLALNYRAVGRFKESITTFETTLAQFASKLGADHPDTLTVQHNLGLAHQAAGHAADALRLFRATLERRESKLGYDNYYTNSTRWALGVTYMQVGRLTEAIPMLESTLVQYEATLGPDHLRTHDTRRDLARAYQLLYRFSDAETLLRTNLARVRKTANPNSPAVANDTEALGRNLLKQSRWTQAEPLLRECLVIRAQATPNSFGRFSAMSALGATLLGEGKYLEAEPLLAGGYDGMHARQANTSANLEVYLFEGAEQIVQLYQALGQPDQAAAWAKKMGMADLPVDPFAN